MNDDPTNDDKHPLRQAIIDVCRRMEAVGLNRGTSGNVSRRIEGGLLITPSSLAYPAMQPEDIVELRFDGTHRGRRQPSSEWRFHRDILSARPEVDVVLHNHSTYATALACHERSIPPFHYTTVVAGGHDIRIADYACFGTEALSRAVVEALEGRLACLMAHHGLVTIAPTLDKALALAVEVEALAEMYVHALAIGEPPHLSAAQMDEVMAQMQRIGYGRSAEVEPVAAAPRALKTARAWQAARATRWLSGRREASCMTPGAGREGPPTVRARA